MSLGSYYNVSLLEMDKVLRELGFQPVNVPEAQEVCYAKSISFEGLPTILRVYTAILKSGPMIGRSRGPGKDAIRLVLGRWDKDFDNGWQRDPSKPNYGQPLPKGRTRVFMSMTSVKRTGAWESNLRARVAEVAALDRMRASATELPVPPDRAMYDGETVKLVVDPQRRPKCPKCGAETTAPKLGRKGWFYGCSKFNAGTNRGGGGCNGLVDALSFSLKAKREEEAEAAAVEVSVREEQVAAVEALVNGAGAESDLFLPPK